MTYYHKNTKQLLKLKLNDKILFKTISNTTWSNFKIIEVCDQPRSYRVGTDDGKIYRRNRKCVIKFASKSQVKIKNDLNDNNNKTFLEKSIDTNLEAEKNIGLVELLLNLKCF